MYLQLFGPSCSGKTTLAAYLLNTAKAAAFVEPTGESRYYPLFLEDKKRWAFKNQVDFLRISFKKELAIARAGDGLVVQDAGLVVCHEVYSNFFRDAGYLSEVEYSTVSEIYRRKIGRCRTPDLAIYLSAHVPVLIERAFNRDNRLIHDFETIMPYWERLAEKLQAGGVPFLAIDTSELDSREVIEIVRERLATIG